MSLEELLDSALPLNRKERYFTGTVFPMIVAVDGFQDLHLLAELIPGCTLPPIDSDPRTTNIQFFTEYSLVESIYGARTKKRFPKPPNSKDTPDIMILVRAEQTQLLAFEAKMYDRPAASALAGQIAAQRIQLNYLQQRLSLDAIHHVALLPAGYAGTIAEQLSESFLGAASGTDTFPIVLWEDILERYRSVRGESDYFLGMLAAALERWEELAARASAYRANAERLLSGAEIIELAEAGDPTVRIVGRQGGLFGKKLAGDISSGKWRYREYEVSSAPEPPSGNPNWFTVEEFVALVQTS